jgi:hypothetical protein
MNKLPFVFALVILVSGLAQAQSTSEEQTVQVYGVAGLARPSGGPNQFQVGGGAEVFVAKGLSAGGEFSYVKASEGADTKLFSANGSYHFLGRAKGIKFDPFATGGFTRFFASGEGANALNFGGGFNYFLSEGFGLKVDFRDYVIDGSNSIGLRGGVVLAF